jgi:uncharacterized protein (TIGR02284 family)
MDQNHTVSVVQDLIQTCRDGQKGYQDAGTHAKRPDIKTLFFEEGIERGRFAEELQGELNQLGEKDEKVSGTVGGALHRAWIDTKVAMGGGDTSILESVEAGEDKAKEAYKKALAESLPTNVAQIVRRQADRVQQAHDKIRALRDSAKAA